jgi:hypothetical protein
MKADADPTLVLDQKKLAQLLQPERGSTTTSCGTSAC